MYQHRYITASLALTNRNVREQTAKESIMAKAANTYTKIYGSKLRETDKAIYFKVQKVAFEDAPNAFDSAEQDTFWFPISQMKSMFTGSGQTLSMDMIEVADWILIAKGIISGEKS